MNAVAVEMEYEPVADLAAPTLLKQQVNERLASHRSRRAQTIAQGGAGDPGSSAHLPMSTRSRSKQIASAVAQRYASSPTYHAFLAAEAEEATRRARAAAEIAARTAEAVAAVQRELMEELAVVASLTEETPMGHDLESAFAPLALVEEAPAPMLVPISRAELSVRLFEDAGQIPFRGRTQVARPGGGNASPDDPDEARALDEEISFRQSPTFDLERPSVAIPGNLLEFPRQLVAARKARPRYAEGPLMAEGTQNGTQLRIFEVEAEQMEPTPPVDASAAEWTSIWLDAPVADRHVEPVEESAAESVAVPLHPATVERRVMAMMVDICLVLAGYAGFAMLFAYRAAVLPSMGLAATVSLGVIVGLFAMYQALFFTFSDCTPGMRYARIGLCTFSDENPTRAAMRRRTLAVFASACPVGLGFLWALVDDDRLGWHDRLSRMYQRSY